MSYGLTYETIMHSTLKVLMLYDKAHEIKMKEIDLLNWSLGKYVAEAIASTIGNAFIGKSGKPHEYPKKPYLDNAENVSEIDMKKQHELLFARLNAMKTNYELNKK